MTRASAAIPFGAFAIRSEPEFFFCPAYSEQIRGRLDVKQVSL